MVSKFFFATVCSFYFPIEDLCRYLSYVHLTGRVWHKASFRWSLAQGCSLDIPGGFKNDPAPVGIHLKWGVSGKPRPHQIRANLPTNSADRGVC